MAGGDAELKAKRAECGHVTARIISSTSFCYIIFSLTWEGCPQKCFNNQTNNLNQSIGAKAVVCAILMPF